MKLYPKQWAKTKLGDVAQVEMGQSPDSRTYNDSGEGLPFFQGKAEFGKLYPTIRRWCSYPIKVAEAGDILLSVRAPVGPTNLAPEKCCIGRGLAAIRAEPHIEQKYLLHYFRYLEPWLMQQGTGSTFAAISGEFIRSIEIPLAPHNEQKRIVDKLDSLLARVDACRAHLDRVPKIIKRFRQAALEFAVTGKLTKDWREEKNLQKDWAIHKIGEVTSKVGSGATPRGGEKAYKLSGIPLIRSMNVIFYGFKREGLAFLDKNQADKLRNVEVKANDVLLNITGASIGRVTLAPKDMEGARVNQHVCIIRPDITVMPEFLCAFLSAPRMQAIIGAENYGVTRQGLTKEQILNFEIPIPSIEEQVEIERRLKKMFAYADRLEACYDKVSHYLEILPPTLFAKAFRGELVPQDPNDEPAAVLLERISLERSKQDQLPKPDRKVTKPRETKMTESELKEIIRKLPKDTFSFDDLRERIPGDYEQIKRLLFSVLSEADAIITQVFDPNVEAIRFVRRER